MTYYSCFDQKGNIIARCQTKEDIDVLKKMGRPIMEIKEMKKEESIVCKICLFRKYGRGEYLING